MSKLEYSIDARNVLKRFFQVERIVYVEGDDDINFWEYMFEKYGHAKVKVEESGGKERLNDRIMDIKSGKAEYYVAIDSDYDIVIEQSEHPNILKTYGYSIENTIVSGEVLQRVISRVAKVPLRNVPVQHCTEWIAEMNNITRTLVLHDIVNRIQGHGVTVITENCDRFLQTSTSCKMCPERISSYLSQLSFFVEPEMEEEISSMIRVQRREWVDLLRGHFLFSAAFRFVKETIRKLRTNVTISKEMFFGSMMLAFETTYCENHSHYSFYQEMLPDTS